jgi:hypothetical protein
MSSLSSVGREVLRARLHATTHVTNIGNLGPQIDKSSSKGLTDITFICSPEGIVLKGKNKNGELVDALIPMVNVISLEFKPETNNKAASN